MRVRKAQRADTLPHLVCRSLWVANRVESWFPPSPVPCCPHTSSVRWSRGTGGIHIEMFAYVSPHNTESYTIIANTTTGLPPDADLQRCVPSVVIALRHVGSNNGVPLWTGGLHTVPVVLTVSFGTLRLVWKDKNKQQQGIISSFLINLNFLPKAGGQILEVIHVFILLYICYISNTDHFYLHN